jgi:hypothetical protein
MKTHDSAVEQYGEGERAHRTAFDSLKNSFEKVGDHWEAKARNGPSDAQAAQRGFEARNNPLPTHGGVDATKSRDDLRKEARSLGVHNYSSMRKAELVNAIDNANRRKTARANRE